MGFTIHGLLQKKYRPRASRFSDGEIREVAPAIIKLQSRGVIIPRDLADSMNEERVPRPGGGEWNATLIYFILQRGTALGLPFIRRDRSDAASRRRVNRRPKCVIAAERAEMQAKMLTMLSAQTNPAITSPIGSHGAAE